MTLWTFILSVAYVPGWTGWSVPTGWVFLSLTLPFMIWRGPALAWPLQALGLCAAAYVILSLTWAPQPQFAIYSLWMQFCIALAFILGAKLTSLDGLRRGLALGLGANSLLCVAQWWGWASFASYDLTQPSGLLYNPSVAGVAFAAMLLWLTLKREWLYIPALIPGLLLNDTRSWWIGLLALAWIWAARQSRAIAFTALPIGVVIALYIAAPSTNDSVRINLWRILLEHLQWFGYGPGILHYEVMKLNDMIVRPEYAHNEYLDLIFQYGLGAIFILVLAAIPLAAKPTAEWYLYVYLLIVAAYSFQLHSPPMAALYAVLAGYLSRDWNLVWDHSLGRRLVFSPRSCPA